MNTALLQEREMNALEYFNNELAADVWTNKYQLKDLDGHALEATPDDMHKRLAQELARIEYSYPNPTLEKMIFNSFKKFQRILPQGSPMATIGDNLRYASISNCVVIAPPYDSYGGITYTDQQLAQLCKRRCGVGFNISTIRPSGLVTKNAAGTTDGIGVFMKRWSNTTNEVAQKGRRGALMLSISVHHPEIDTFLTIKEDRTQVTGANITVEVTDEFMLAVINDDVYEQRWFNSRGEKEISRFVKARPIFESLAKHAHSSAEPGVAFIDTIYRRTPGHSYKLFQILGCNPCSEIWMGANDTCRLFGINVAHYVIAPFTKYARFDYEAFEKDIRLSQRLMDDVVDLEIEKINKILEKIESDPEPDYVKATEKQTWEAIKHTATRGRRTGLGITAIADCLAKLGKPYSKDSFDFIESLYQTLAVTAFSESIRMASERGAFPEYNAEIDKNESHIQFLLKYVSDDDVHLYNLYGRRNIACTTSAPYGSVGIVTHFGSFNGRDYFGTSSGIEPVFKSAYTRKRKVLDDSEFDEVDAVGVKWKRYTVYHSGRQMYLDMKNANVQDLIDYDPYVGSESHDLHYEDRVQMQARAQRWIDHAISSTVNLAKDVSVDVVQNIYMDAWKSGCKGITVYREGSRDAVLSDIGPAQKFAPTIAEHHAIKRPEQLKAEVVHLKLKNTAFNMYIGLLNDMPFEVFLVEEKIPLVLDKELYIVKHPRKASSRYSLHSADNMICRDINASSDPTIAAISRLISLNLRHGTPIEFICEQLDRSKHTEFSSLPAMISRSLKKYIQDNKKRQGSCSQCGSSNLEYKEGCLSCPDCGYSKCG